MELNRRDFAIFTAGAAAIATSASARGQAEITHDNLAIHQEVIFAGAPDRIYRMLTTADEFDKVVRLSGAMNSSMKARLGSAPTAIDPRPGGAFTLFGGYITGFSVELVPNARLVQAWRAGSWDPGNFSIAHFVLEPSGASTRIIFDHTGFPAAEAQHLASGWHTNYWQPMAKALA